MLYGREPIPFQTLNFATGTEQATHSDTIHFHCDPSEFMCAVWVALEDVGRENGPLHYYPGSQKLPILSMQDLNLKTGRPDYDRYERRLQERIDKSGLKRQEAFLRKGQAFLWAANLLHGGSAILDKRRTRHSQVTHYYFSGCSYHVPMMSEISHRNVFKKRVVNISTGKEVSHVSKGHKLNLSLKERLFWKV